MEVTRQQNVNSGRGVRYPCRHCHTFGFRWELEGTDVIRVGQRDAVHAWRLLHEPIFITHTVLEHVKHFVVEAPIPHPKES